MSATISHSDQESHRARIVRWPVSMRWQNLLFAHWPIEPDKIRGLLPPNLELDTYDGQAWIGIVPFYLTIRINWMPFAFEFPEVNVRTYAKHRGKTGVWFLSLDASSRLAVTTARLAYCLPYHKAKMKMQIDRQSAARWIQFSSRRTDRSTALASLEMEYGPIGESFHAEPGSLEHWLTERYTLFAVTRKGSIVSADVEHVPWPLCRAEAAFKTNTMLQPLGLKIPGSQPLLHFAHDMNVVASSLRNDEVRGTPLIHAARKFNAFAWSSRFLAINNFVDSPARIRIARFDHSGIPHPGSRRICGQSAGQRTSQKLCQRYS